MKTLCIAHRMSPYLAKEAVGFSSKTQMLVANAKSIAKAIKNIDTKLYLIFDSCTKQQIELVKDIFTPSEKLEVYFAITENYGNQRTFAYQVKLLANEINKCKYLYFSEDDYLYKEYAFEEMIKFLSRPDVDFVSALDHPDRYTHKIPECIKTELQVSDRCHWRKSETTCCTFMTKGEVLAKTKEKLMNYLYSEDGSMWESLTRDSLYNPALMIKAFLVYLQKRKNKESLDKYDPKLYPFRTIMFYGLRVLVWKRYSLWNAVPTLAVHLCKNSIPAFSEEINDYKNLANFNELR